MNVPVTLLAIVFLLSSCAGTSGAPLKPAETAALRVQRAVEQSARTADDPEAFVVQARFNPVDCDAPPWELRLHGSWTRAALRASREMTSEASILLTDDDMTEGSIVWLRVAPTTRSEPGADGLRFRVVELLDIENR